MKNKLKTKFLNHLLRNGNKKTCENVLLKCFKNLQKSSNKCHKKILKLALINSTPVFRIIVLKNNKTRKKNRKSKEIPKLITKNFERISWSIKYILNFTKQSFPTRLRAKLGQEIILNAKNKGNATKKVSHHQKQLILNKRFLLHFRW